MWYKMLRNTLIYFKNFLALVSICLFSALFIVKWKIYNIKKNIIIIDCEITKVQEEIKIMETELSYLTNPKRLKQIYYKINKCNDCASILSINQIKSITDILPFYYAKYSENSKSVALNDTSK